MKRKRLQIVRVQVSIMHTGLSWTTVQFSETIVIKLARSETDRPWLELEIQHTYYLWTSYTKATLCLSSNIRIKCSSLFALVLVFDLILLILTTHNSLVSSASQVCSFTVVLQTPKGSGLLITVSPSTIDLLGAVWAGPSFSPRGKMWMIATGIQCTL